MPLPLAMFLFILALVFLFRNKHFKAKVTLSLALLWLFLISYPPLVNSLLYDYEASYPTLHTAPKDIQYIYVLGGGHSSDENLPISSEINEPSLVRLAEGIRLYQQLKPQAKLIVSGYAGLHDPHTHALMQEKLALALGIPQKDILLEPKPRDTEEEAIAAKARIGSKPFILVTSASHMKRAMGFFTQKGLQPIPAPTNHLAHVKYPDYTNFFSSRALKKSSVIWHEILGLLWQKIKGI